MLGNFMNNTHPKKLSNYFQGIQILTWLKTVCILIGWFLRSQAIWICTVFKMGYNQGLIICIVGSLSCFWCRLLTTLIINFFIKVFHASECQTVWIQNRTGIYFLTLFMLGNFSCFCSCLLTFFNIILFKKVFQ